MWARIYLIPALQAEEDRDQVRRHLADKAREKELLGTETKVYNSDRWVSGNAVVRRIVTDRTILDSFDLPLQSPPSTRRSKRDTLHWACTYKYRDGGVSKPSLAIPCGTAFTESTTSFVFILFIRARGDVFVNHSHQLSSKLRLRNQVRCVRGLLTIRQLAIGREERVQTAYICTDF
jgi:hypothetical protein